MNKITISGDNTLVINRPNPYRVDIEGVKLSVHDGYHSIDELYKHRIALFAALCNLTYLDSNFEPAGKSKLHSDGTMFEGGYFIAWVETPNGLVTYHMKIEEWWDKFKVPEFENAPEWDGHTPNDCIERLLSI